MRNTGLVSVADEEGGKGRDIGKKSERVGGVGVGRIDDGVGGLEGG